MKLDSSVAHLIKQRWPDCDNLRQGGNSWVVRVTQGTASIGVKIFRLVGNNARYVRFKEEVKSVGKLSDIEGIVPIFESNLPETLTPFKEITNLSALPYFTMPWHAESLLSVIDGNPKDDGSNAVELTRRIANIIAAIHRRNHAHRDLKPDNILISSVGTPLVSDFGLCLDLTYGPMERDTVVSEIVGAIAYRAPEFLRGRLDHSDHRPGDVFALARILWALLLGREPYNVTDFEFASVQIRQEVARLRNPGLLEPLIASATHADPNRRPNIDQFIEGLETWQRDFSAKSVDGLIREIQNSGEHLAVTRARAQSAEILSAHDVLFSTLKEEVERLTKDWAKIIERTERGNAVSVSRGSDFHGHVGPSVPGFPIDANEIGNVETIIVQFNLGTNTRPILNLCVAVHLDLNDWAAQKYIVIAACVPAGVATSPIFREESQLVPFRYDDPGLHSRILVDVRAAFTWLEEKLHAD